MRGEFTDSYCVISKNIKEQPTSETGFIYQLVKDKKLPFKLSNQLLGAKIAGAKGSLVAIERLVMANPTEVNETDLHSLLPFLMSNPALNEQLNLHPKRSEKLLLKIRELGQDLKIREHFGSFFILLQLEARLRVSLEGAEAREKLRLLAEEALSTLAYHEKAYELKQGPEYAMKILAELPVYLWEPRDRLTFNAYFKAYTYLTGKNGQTFPDNLSPDLHYLRFIHCPEPSDGEPSSHFTQALVKGLGAFIQIEEDLEWKWQEGCLVGSAKGLELVWHSSDDRLLINGKAALQNLLKSIHI